MLNANDLQKLNKAGIDKTVVEEQLKRFETGFPFLKIKSAAGAGCGVLRLSADEQKKFEDIYESFDGSKTKFVPASGAASRMFKSLFEAKEMLESGADAGTVSAKNRDAEVFFENLAGFAFYDELLKYKTSSSVEILNSLLTSQGLNYGNMPKGVLLFHRYKNFKRTPFEEHLAEAAKYAQQAKTKTANLHFTVSDEHVYLFKKLLDQTVKSYNDKYGIAYNVNFSTQRKTTDTIAVTSDNLPFRNSDGSLVFYPGGHGALLENLNEIDSDIVFIKNVDNVVPETKLAETVRWKKIIAGVLIDCRNKIFEYVNCLQTGGCSKKHDEIVEFLSKTLCIDLPKNADGKLLMSKLNRPIRVCGMVKNEGEPGGGPFLINESDGTTSLQILESSQIDKTDENAMKMLASSTHFNPVDLVCCIKNCKGEKFNLVDFRDSSTGFISEKSRAGKKIKVLELPGLWNGAMSKWNTVFVEAPIETFNPVKTVNDLLREQHQV
ncbi:MAG: DUF4301 family protein [Prevotellaceae bacterium]|jgi:hypothetical protein|nr:DUF4301 family protein [Prevotellaceae bacterium]